jgi:tetratricopeptide (TPR) repeat protein
MIGVSSILSYRGNYGDAFDFLDSICSILPCRQQCDMMRFKIYSCRKEIKEAEKYYVSALADGYTQNESDELYVAFLFNETGKHEKAISILHNLVDRDEGLLKTGAKSRVTAYISTLRLAAAYAMMGEKKEALKYLAALEEYLLIEYPYPVKSFPGFDSLRNDPEFKTIINKIEYKKALIREQIKKMEERGEINL